ncbi:MAG TPA: Clp protease N-terminal domain-containing protein [Candidatus Dormibacteraeota bacterium]
MYPFERFTAVAKQMLILAQEEAERAHHHWIGTEHVLLAIAQLEEGTGCRVLRELEVDPADVRQGVEAVLEPRKPGIPQRIIPTARVKKVIEIAFAESNRLRHRYVGTGEVLLALVSEGEGVAAHVLKDLGVERAALEQKVESAPPEDG